MASLATTAMQDGDEWIVNGQKVWTTFGHESEMAMLIARTDPDQPKHKGITYFALDMRAPGVEVRPLINMAGQLEFNEIFLTDVRIPDLHRISPVGEGWAEEEAKIIGRNPRRQAVRRSGRNGDIERPRCARPSTTRGRLRRRSHPWADVTAGKGSGRCRACTGARGVDQQNRQGHVEWRSNATSLASECSDCQESPTPSRVSPGAKFLGAERGRLGAISVVQA